MVLRNSAHKEFACISWSNRDRDCNNANSLFNRHFRGRRRRGIFPNVDGWLTGEAKLTLSVQREEFNQEFLLLVQYILVVVKLNLLQTNPGNKGKVLRQVKTIKHGDRWKKIKPHRNRIWSLFIKLLLPLRPLLRWVQFSAFIWGYSSTNYWMVGSASSSSMTGRKVIQLRAA